MFTPERNNKVWSGLSSRNGDRISSVGKGKSTVTTAPVNGGRMDGGGAVDGGCEWQRFKKEEMLDEASLEKKDRETLIERILKLENELFDYQYNMGLLLIEKKQWTSEYEELRQALVETNAMLKREQAAYLKAVSEVEKREENLRKAWRVEKQYVADMEVQKLLHEQNSIPDSKKHEFELQMNQNNKSLAEDMKSKVVAVKQKEIDIILKEEKICKGEQALEKMLEKSMEKEREFESKWKALREMEKSIKAKEKNLEMEKKQLIADKENLQIVSSELEKEREDLSEKQLQLHKERENLKITEEERSKLHYLQSELKQERDQCVLQRELILKEREDLKQDRENFEREWEILDEKRAEIAEELKQFSEEKGKLEELKHSKQETLTNEKLVTQDYVQRELEALRMEKESLQACLEHERSLLAEKVRTEHEDMLNDFELQKRELEANMQNRQHEMEIYVWDKERAFEEEKERELKNINYLRELARREKEDMKLERLSITNEKQEVATNKKHFQEQQLEMQKFIDKLDVLVKKLKDQREQYKTFVEKLKSCENCGEVLSDSVLSDLQSLQEMDDLDALSMPRLAKDYERQNTEVSPSGTGFRSVPASGNMSWLRKCTSKIFNISPLKRSEDAVGQGLSEVLPVSATQVKIEASTGLGATVNEAEAEPSLWMSSDSFDVQGSELNNSVRAFVCEPTPFVDAQSNIGNKALEGTEDTQQSELRSGRGKPGMKRKPGVRRTRSLKPGAKDAKSEDSIDVNGENLGASTFVDKRAATGKKRTYVHASRTTMSEQDADNSEAHSDSVTEGGRRKRQQTVVLALETPGAKRYNLRRPKTVSKAATVRASSNLKKVKEKEANGGMATVEEASKQMTVIDSLPGIASENGKSTTLNSIVEVNVPLEKFVRFGTAEENDCGDTCTTDGSEYVYGREVSGEVVYEDEDEDSEEGDYEYEHQELVTIGKKLWTFFTT